MPEKPNLTRLALGYVSAVVVLLELVNVTLDLMSKAVNYARKI